MGVYRRGKTWYIRYRDPNGKEVRKSTNQESKKTAQTILAKIQTDIAENRYLDRQERPEMTFSELCDWYWEHHGQYLKSNGIQGMLRRFREFFEDTSIMGITPENISQFVQYRKSARQVSPSNYQQGSPAS